MPAPASTTSPARRRARSGEWREGIARLLERARCRLRIGTARALLAPYLDAVAALNAGGRLTTYPGSPALVRALLRPQDRLSPASSSPTRRPRSRATSRGDRRSKAIAIDGWTALNAYVPPKERRGLVLIDPPFEEPDDFPRLAQALEAAHRKWASGIYLLWYPIKERGAPDALARRLRALARQSAKILRVELSVARAARTGPPRAPAA